MIVSMIDFLRNNLKTVKNISVIFLILAIIMDVFVSRHHHEHFWGDNVRGFWALFGAIGCILMIKICKGISHLWLMKQEDYYE